MKFLDGDGLARVWAKIKDTFAYKTDIKTPNWDASEGEDGYIENRTHYEEILGRDYKNTDTDYVYVEMSTDASSFDVKFAYYANETFESINELRNRTLTLVFNGEPDSGELTSVTNHTTYWTAGAGTNDLVIYVISQTTVDGNTFEPGLYILVGMMGVTADSYELTKYDYIKKLDEKYIPGTIARTTDIPTTDQSYSNLSQNPQSGTAVAGAIANVTALIPIKTSDLTNDGIGGNPADPFITKTVDNLTNYYRKSDIDAMISARLKIQVVDTLPIQDIDTSTVYLVPEGGGSSSSDNTYEEYVYIIDEESSLAEGHWEMIGTSDVDLTGYMQRSNNLRDVDDRQTALNNLTNASVSQAGKYLTVDSIGNVTFGTVATQSQADWTQSDNTQVDYIKNRTHYTSIEEVTKSQKTITFTSDGTYAVGSGWGYSQSDGLFDSFVEGELFKVYIGDTLYSGTVHRVVNGPQGLSDARWIGNGSILNSNLEDTGENWCIGSTYVAYNSLSFYVDESLVGSMLVKFNHDDEIIHPLDEKYVPTNIPRKSEVTTRLIDADGTNYGVSRDSLGTQSFGEGSFSWESAATGYHAVSFGGAASGNHSFSANNGSANGAYSAAFGGLTDAVGGNSVAMGNSTVANGNNSLVYGCYNIADNLNNWTEWVAGTSYNVGDRVKFRYSTDENYTGYICKTANSDSYFNSSKWDSFGMNYVEIVGNGTYNNPSNARTLDWDGNEVLAGGLTLGGPIVGMKKSISISSCTPDTYYTPTSSLSSISFDDTNCTGNYNYTFSGYFINNNMQQLPSTTTGNIPIDWRGDTGLDAGEEYMFCATRILADDGNGGTEPKYIGIVTKIS